MMKKIKLNKIEEEKDKTIKNAEKDINNNKNIFSHEK